MCCPQFGTQNDKEIMKVNPNVHHIRNGWFKDVLWSYVIGHDLLAGSILAKGRDSLD
jgi:hypothetical protein